MKISVALCILGTISANFVLAKPNVLFIAVDDMNDWISLLDPDAPILTPNLERLARRGVSFTRAYSVSPACNPSRVATITGIRPSTSGVYGNASDWRKALPDRLTIFQRFREEGYSVVGSGKIFHHHLDGAFHDVDSFEAFEPMGKQFYPDGKLNQSPEYGSRNTDWGVWPPRVEQAIDYRSVNAAMEMLKNADPERPLFVACGIFKPHSPFFAPLEFQEELSVMPPRKGDDWSDLPSGATKLMKRSQWFWEGMMEVEKEHPGAYRDFAKSYAACARFADVQVGRLIDAWFESDRSEKSIIVLWSDHGFHLGEKDHIEKFALWEKTNRIPFIIVAPVKAGVGNTCDTPVDLTALYPTLLELCDFESDPLCEGLSLVPLLKNPERDWETPALMTYGKGNHAVRSRRWRYIRYADGSEELYDHDSDPNEWENLAVDQQYRTTMDELARWLPEIEAEEVPPLKK